MSTTSAVPEHDRVVAEVVDAFLAGYWSTRTRANYAFILGGWIDWCAAHHVDVVGGVDPRVVEAWVGDLQLRRHAAKTIAGRMSAVSAFYRWCVREQLLARSPVDAVRRPHRPTESSTASLTVTSSPTASPPPNVVVDRGGPRRCCSH